MTQNNILDINSAAANVGAAILIADIQDTRNMLAGMNLPKTLQVGTSDAGSYFNNMVLEAVDYGVRSIPSFLFLAYLRLDGQCASMVRERLH